MNKVCLSNRPEPVFQEDSEWKEFVIKKEDLNESVFKIIYDTDDVGFAIEYMEKHFKHDKRRKNVYFYSNSDIVGLKNFMQYIDTPLDEPNILE